MESLRGAHPENVRIAGYGSSGYVPKTGVFDGMESAGMSKITWRRCLPTLALMPLSSMAFGCGDGGPYFVVGYGSLPTGCAVHERLHIYSVDSELLMHSESVALTDKNLTDAHQQYRTAKSATNSVRDSVSVGSGFCSSINGAFYEVS
jgi:hypothetical protein